jgi:hypothetical protein
MTKRYNDSTCRSHVQKNKKYDVNELMRENIFWWINSRRMYQKVLQKDINTRNILKTEIVGSGTGNRYVILGKNIINFYKVYGPGISLLKS